MAKDAKPEGGKKSGGLVGILVVTLMALGGGGGFGWYISGMLKEREPEAAPGPAKKEAAGHGKGHETPAEKPEPTMLVELKPIIANLSDPKSAWIRVEASVVVTKDVEEVHTLAGQIAEDLTAYLRSTSLAQFEGPSGFQSLREDLNERARLRGGKDVKEVVVHGMVVE